MFTEEQTIALEVVSYVGVTLSLIGLVVTMITLLIFKYEKHQVLIMSVV